MKGNCKKKKMSELKTKSKYLVVYASQNGIGNIDCMFRHEPPTMQDVRDAEKQIKELNKLEKNPVILNWLKISEDDCNE